MKSKYCDTGQHGACAGTSCGCLCHLGHVPPLSDADRDAELVYLRERVNAQAELLLVLASESRP